jgi:hypothetical protein
MGLLRGRPEAFLLPASKSENQSNNRCRDTAEDVPHCVLSETPAEKSAHIVGQGV